MYETEVLMYLQLVTENIKHGLICPLSQNSNNFA
jgi:hypothetical protein